MNMNFVTAAGVAAIITASLLLAMEGLVRLAPGMSDERPPGSPVIWTEVRQDTDTQTDDFEKPDIPDPIEPPPSFQPPAPTEHATVLPVPRPPVPVEESGTGTGLPTISDSPLISVIRVSPQYPTSPLSNGLSGYVDVEFDVLTNGTVANARVIGSSNRLFERNALKAIQKFKYKAPVIDGVPQITYGLRYRFRFEIDD